MATLATQPITQAGVAASYSAATATTGDLFKPEPGTVLHVKNGGGAPTTVTFDAVASPGGMQLTDPTVSVVNATDKFIKPPDGRYLKDGNGMAKVTCNPVTSVTIAVLKV